MTRWPPLTNVSLLAVATILPALKGREYRPQADDAGRAHQHQVDAPRADHVLERGHSVAREGRRGRSVVRDLFLE